MKKKIAILTAVVALIVVFAVVLTSCGIADKVSSLIPGGDGGDGNTISPANDYDSTQIESHINALAAQGIKISLRVTGSDDDEGEYEAETYAYGAYGDIFYYCYGEEDEQMYFDLSSDDQFVLYQMEQDGFDYYWTKTIYYYDDLYNKAQLKQVYGGMAVGIWGMLGYYAGLNGEGTKTTATMLNRTCDKYVMTQSVAVIGAAASISYECWIDQQTGVCLKYAISGSAVSTDGRESGSFAIEATEFNTNWRPQLPEVSQAHTEVMNPESAPQGGNGSQGQGGNGNESQGEGGGNQSQGEGGQGEGGGNQGQQPGEDGTIGGGGNGESGEGGGQVIGGEGESNESQTQPVFINKRFETTQVQSAEEDAVTALANAYVDIYNDGMFEIVNGDFVYIGKYREISEDMLGLVAYLRYYNGAYTYDASFSATLIHSGENYFMRAEDIEYEDGVSADAATLWLSVSNDDPMKSDIPYDPNKNMALADFDAYQVTQEIWAEFFEGIDYLDANFTMTGIDPLSGDTVIYKFADGNVYIGGYENGNELYYVRTGSVEGGYTYECYRVNKKESYFSHNPIDLPYDFFRDSDRIGLLPKSFLTAKGANLSYDEGNYYYECSSFSYYGWDDPDHDYEPHQITRFRVYFEDGALKKITFKEIGSDFVFNFSNVGTTVIDLSDLA